MPNIMICGFPTAQADTLKVKIDQVLSGLGLDGDAVTSITEMCAESCDGKRIPMPYLRICSTDEYEIRRIIEALKNAKLGIDVEWLVLGGFIPAAEMG